MGREVRCQGVILKDRQVLVMRHYNSLRKEEYWMLPGGGLENNETEEECVIREIKEEANMDVDVIDILLNNEGTGIDVYKRYVTFLCVPKDKSMGRVGNETDNHRKILDLVWCSLDDENSWSEYIKQEQFFPTMKSIKERLIDIKAI